MTDDALRSRRILVAESDPALAQGLADALAAAGAAVIGPARRVEEALALAANSAPDGAILAIDLDGEVTTSVIVALRILGVPVVLAIDDVSAYPTFWIDQVPRVASPVSAGALLAALAPGLDGQRLRRAPGDDLGRRAAVAELIERDGHSRASRDAAVRAAARYEQEPDASLPVVELDAGRWRNALDLYEALGAALGMPGHSTNLDGWLEIILDGASFGARQPPYAIRIVNAARCKPGVRTEMAFLASMLRQARAEWGKNPKAHITVVS